MSTSPQLPASGPGVDVVIVGGGIAGLAAAYELSLGGTSCVVLEQASRFRAGGEDDGAGITIDECKGRWPRFPGQRAKSNDHRGATRPRQHRNMGGRRARREHDGTSAAPISCEENGGRNVVARNN